MASALIDMILNERELESVKIEALNQGDFNLLDLFKQFDCQTITDVDLNDPSIQKGLLCQQDFKKCLIDIY